MTNSKNLCLSAIGDFLSKPPIIEFKSVSKEDRNEWIQKVIMDYKYLKCSRLDKGMLRQYIVRMTSISKSQLTRLISEYKRRGTLKSKPYKRNKFETIYTKGDVELLVSLDNAHECLAGPATVKIMKSDYANFGKIEYIRLKDISVSHLYRLRITDRYRYMAKTFTKTNPTKVNIGERRKPEPNGKPGYLCVDTVHQGDKNGEKGVYHINIVDMTTQFEFVGSVEAISEKYMKKVLDKDAFTSAGRTKKQNNYFNFTKKVFNWRKGKSVIHTGKTMQFIPENNVYVFFRYSEKERVMVVINNSPEAQQLNLNRFKEMIKDSKFGKDIISDKVILLGEKLVVSGKSSMIIELN